MKRGYTILSETSFFNIFLLLFQVSLQLSGSESSQSKAKVNHATQLGSSPRDVTSRNIGRRSDFLGIDLGIACKTPKLRVPLNWLHQLGSPDPVRLLESTRTTRSECSMRRTKKFHRTSSSRTSLFAFKSSGLESMYSLENETGFLWNHADYTSNDTHLRGSVSLQYASREKMK